MDYALQLLIPILLGLYGGQWLDKKLGTGYWFTLGGMLLGTLLGMGILYKRALMIQQKRQEAKNQPQPPEENS